MISCVINSFWTDERCPARCHFHNCSQAHIPLPSLWSRCRPTSAFRVKWLGEIYQTVLWIGARAEAVSKQPKTLENPRGHKIISICFLVLYPKNLIGCKGCVYKMESCSLANLKYECTALKLSCCWWCQLKAYASKEQGKAHSVSPEQSGLLTRGNHAHSRKMPWKHFSDTSRRCFISFVENQFILGSEWGFKNY